MTGYQWADLPAAVRAQVETFCGFIREVIAVPAGLTAGIAVRLDTERGPLFLKALPADSPSAVLYQREQQKRQTDRPPY